MYFFDQRQDADKHISEHSDYTYSYERYGLPVLWLYKVITPCLCEFYNLLVNTNVVCVVQDVPNKIGTHNFVYSIKAVKPVPNILSLMNCSEGGSVESRIYHQEVDMKYVCFKINEIFLEFQVKLDGETGEFDLNQVISCALQEGNPSIHGMAYILRGKSLFIQMRASKQVDIKSLFMSEIFDVHIYPERGSHFLANQRQNLIESFGTTTDGF